MTNPTPTTPDFLAPWQGPGLEPWGRVEARRNFKWGNPHFRRQEADQRLREQMQYD